VVEGIRVVDAWVNHNPPELAEKDWSDSPAVASLFKLFPATAELMIKGTTDAEMVEAMDSAGVDVGVLSSYSYTKNIKELMAACEAVAETCRTYPGRFVGSARLECLIKDGPTIREGVRAVETMARDLDFAAVRIMPAMAQLPPNHPRYYGIYSACAELGIAVGINVGIPGPRWPAKYQQVSHLDEICIDFPELKLVAAHIGNPWCDELLALMYKYENLYLMTSAWAPKRYPQAIVKALTSSAFRDRIMFATDFPILSFERPISEIPLLELGDDDKRRFLGDNASALFGLDERLGVKGTASSAGSSSIDR
jgi:predicted TIM-barrel fold metal-dependent hydrolase